MKFCSATCTITIRKFVNSVVLCCKVGSFKMDCSIASCAVFIVLFIVLYMCSMFCVCVACVTFLPSLFLK